MAPARPRLRERTSEAYISLIVAASSYSTNGCTAACGLPPGRKTLAEVGKRAYRSALLAMVEAEKAEVGKPCSAHSSAADTESVNDRVPQRSSATHQASGEAGTTVRSKPIGMSPACLVRKSSALARRGYGPTPETSKVSPVEARCTRIGATPAKLTMSGWTTPNMNPAATPASIAFPPSASTRAAACAASGCPAATIHFRPITCVIGPEPAAAALRWYCAESSVMARMLTYRRFQHWRALSGPLPNLVARDDRHAGEEPAAHADARARVTPCSRPVIATRHSVPASRCHGHRSHRHRPEYVDADCRYRPYCPRTVLAAGTLAATRQHTRRPRDTHPRRIPWPIAFAT